MHTRTMPIPVQQVDEGPDFLVYPGKDGTVFIEKLRPNGLRDGQSIFHFDPAALVAAVATAASMTHSVRMIAPMIA